MKRLERTGSGQQSELFSDSTGTRIVRVVPEVVLDQCFDYSLPADKGLPELGQRVRVPWGKKEVLAYVVGFPEQAEVDRCRSLLSVVDEEPMIPAALIELARWMADYYCTEFALVLKGMLPEPVRRRESGFQEPFRARVNRSILPEEVEVLLKGAKAQKRAWAAVNEAGPEGEWLSVLMKETRTSHQTWKGLEAKKLVVLDRSRKDRDPLLGEVPSDVVPELSAAQVSALDQIREIWSGQTRKPILLQGVTGSGKTEIYLRLIEDELKQGRTALALVPEIALTPQTVYRFRARFEKAGHGIAVLHSRLSAGERHDQWHRITRGDARLVIGPRSALFAPLKNLGLIIVDEEHEGSYKQEEAPRYQARDVAVLRGHLQGARVLLGSATPGMESLHNVQTGKFKRVWLKERIDNVPMPVIHILDLRKKSPEGKQVGLLHPDLVAAVRQRLCAKEQVILYLNRRGYSTSLQCPECGHVFECPQCSVPMTFHRSDGRLVCHLCDEEEETPWECPGCRFDKLKYAGTGTQRIEEAVGEHFPDAVWQRMDSDSMSSKNAFEATLSAFRDGEIDILIGTQMLAKGLHFPNVTCVGIINVDQAIQMPDFRAAERVFQQLVQVAGRAGRGSRRGEVYIQTRTPFHPVIQFARHHDVEGFADQEMEFRQAQRFPPFRRAILVTVSSPDDEKAQFGAEQVYKRLSGPLGQLGLDVPEPLPAPIAKLRNRYRYQIMLLTDRVRNATACIRKHVIDVDWPEGIRVTVDVDPYSLL